MTAVLEGEVDVGSQKLWDVEVVCGESDFARIVGLGPFPGVCLCRGVCRGFVFVLGVLATGSGLSGTLSTLGEPGTLGG